MHSRSVTINWILTHFHGYPLVYRAHISSIVPTQCTTHNFSFYLTIFLANSFWSGETWTSLKLASCMSTLLDRLRWSRIQVSSPSYKISNWFPISSWENNSVVFIQIITYRQHFSFYNGVKTRVFYLYYFAVSLRGIQSKQCNKIRKTRARQ